MKKIWISAIGVFLVLIAIFIGASYLANDRTPSILGDYYSPNDSTHQPSKQIRISFFEEKYSIFYQGKVFDEGKYKRYKKHSYLLNSKKGYSGTFILTDQKVFYLIIPKINKKPFIMKKEAGSEKQYHGEIIGIDSN
ncbi:hypothetical protein Q2T76_01430 [Lactobacillus sp. YT155]|uniref:hypothetical protein n=1 Tax=Lactobacillus sp. YT155 TaxID=3060955 RepID=UPI00265FD8AB|nr:hypothetical protein [Lactobacillus sp. YT155]MDO1604712.1 hypothetical protein [Lactobacillus sp. YT155]